MLSHAIKPRSVMSILGAGLVLGLGTAQAAVTNKGDNSMPATEHQEDVIEVSGGPEHLPTYQYTRRGADFAAMLPVTRHQANVLQLQSVRPADIDLSSRHS